MSPSQSGALYSQKNEMNVCPRIPISLLASHHEGMSHQNLNCLRAGMILQVLAASRQDKRHVCMHAGRQTHVLIPVAGRVGWTSGSPMWVAENTHSCLPDCRHPPQSGSATASALAACCDCETIQALSKGHQMSGMFSGK